MAGESETTDEEAFAKAVAHRLLNTPPRPLKSREKSLFSIGERSDIAGLERAAERVMKGKTSD